MFVFFVRLHVSTNVNVLANDYIKWILSNRMGNKIRDNRCTCITVFITSLISVSSKALVDKCSEYNLVILPILYV